MKTTKTKKILIIDDDPNDTFMTKRGLSKSGFDVRVEEAASGEAALELLRNEDELPSLIFLDLKMSGMSGIETLRQIRADKHLKDITVIISTNSLLEADKNASYAAGATGFIEKGFDITLFEREIKAVLERWLKE